MTAASTLRACARPRRHRKWRRCLGRRTAGRSTALGVLAVPGAASHAALLGISLLLLPLQSD